VIIIDKESRIVYAKLVEELSNEPDYESVIKAVKDHL
jgi:hypothetical protein